MSEQLSRQEALGLLKSSPYESEEQLGEDIKYFMKKIGWTKDELEDYLTREPVAHDVYGSEEYVFFKVNRWIKKTKRLFQ